MESEFKNQAGGDGFDGRTDDELLHLWHDCILPIICELVNDRVAIGLLSLGSDCILLAWSVDPRGS